MCQRLLQATGVSKSFIHSVLGYHDRPECISAPMFSERCISSRTGGFRHPTYKLWQARLGPSGTLGKKSASSIDLQTILNWLMSSHNDPPRPPACFHDPLALSSPSNW